MKNTVHYIVLSFLVLILVVLLPYFDIKYPHSSQEESLKFLSVLPVLLLGLGGSFIWDKYVMASNQPRISLKYIKFILIGIGAGLLFVFLDVTIGFSKLMALNLGVSSIHIELPYSIFIYTVAAIIVESIYHLIPIGILFWIISRLLLKGKGRKYTFWTLAVLFSLLEPISQLVAFEMISVSLIILGLLIFAFNLLLCFLMFRYGVLGAILSRWSFYMIWHVLIGPWIVYS